MCFHSIQLGISIVTISLVVREMLGAVFVIQVSLGVLQFSGKH